MDSDTGKVVTTVPIGEGVDANRFDPDTQIVFSSNGDGTLTVVHEDTANAYSVLASVATKRGARTMELDPQDAPGLPGHRPARPSAYATAYAANNGARNV